MNTIIRLFLWNMLFAVIIFLPVFLVGVNIELLVSGALTDRTLGSIMSDQLFMFIVLAVPVMLASIVFSLCSLVVPAPLMRRHRRLTGIAFALAFTLILVCLLFIGDVNITGYFIGYLASTIVAALCYGLVAKIGREDTGN